jgi:hypothetical protein
VDLQQLCRAHQARMDTSKVPYSICGLKIFSSYIVNLYRYQLMQYD